MNSGEDPRSAVLPVLFAAAVRGGAAAVVGGLLLLGAARGSVPMQVGEEGSSSCWKPRAAETDFFERANVERQEAGLPELRLDPELSAVARKHTSRMVARNELRHSSIAALRTRVTQWSSLGENVGVGSDPAHLNDAFMASEAHRKNVLSRRFKHVGIGTRRSEGRLWVTFVFEARRDPGTTLPMPDC